MKEIVASCGFNKYLGIDQGRHKTLLTKNSLHLQLQSENKVKYLSVGVSEPRRMQKYRTIITRYSKTGLNKTSINMQGFIS
jgi:hypothetical protein